MKQRRVRFLGALFLLLLSASPSQAAEAVEEHFDLISLEFPDKALDRSNVDVDGDGLLDLVWLFHPADDPESFGLRTCLHASTPRFSACSTLDLPEESRAFDIAPIDGKPGAELILLTRSGALWSSFEGGGFGKPRALPGLQSTLSDTDSVIPRSLPFLFDLDRDGRYEALLAKREGVELHRFAADGSSKGQSLTSPSYMEIARRRRELDLSAFLGRDYSPHVTVQNTTPAVFVEDLNGDGRLDIATISQNKMRIFEQGSDGSFPTTPGAEIERSVVSADEKESGFTGEALTFAELNGDGIMDLIVLKWGSSEERTRMDRHIFLGRGDWQFPDAADQIVRSESFFPNFEIRDVNGDGLEDLIVPYFHFAPSQAIKAVTQNALRLQLRVFLMDAQGRYAQDPGKEFAKVDRRIVVDYHVDILKLFFGGEGAPKSFDPLLSLQHDFNGDGFPDLVVDGGDDTLNFYWGNVEAQYTRGPDLSLDYESSLDSNVSDLNGDGRADIVSRYGKLATGWAQEAASEGYGRTKQARAKQAKRRKQASLPKPSGAETRIQILLSR